MNRYKVEQIHRNVRAIHEPHHDQQVISYLVDDKQYALLIDTGMWVEPLRPIIEKLTNRPVVVIQTHMHFDHMGSSYQWSDIWALDHIQSSIWSKKWRSYEDIIKYDQHVDSDLPHDIKGTYNVHPCNITSFLSDGQSFSTGRHKRKIIATPWHSPDSLSLYEEVMGWLWVGDLVYPGLISVSSDSDRPVFRNSLAKTATCDASYVFGHHNTAWNQKELLERMQFLPDCIISTHKIDKHTSIMINNLSV